METPVEVLARLVAPDAPLVNAALSRLSHLSRAEALSLADAWAELAPQRRLEVATRIQELAEDDAQLDFETVFRERLEDTDAGVRSLAVSGLWECRDPSLIGVLTGLVREDPSEDVQAAAAQALGGFTLLVALGEIRAVYRERLAETLLTVFDDDTRALSVRGRALEAVAPLDLPEVGDAISRAYGDIEPELKISALYAMGANCETVWVETLLDEIDDPDPRVRYEATTALGNIGQPETVTALHARLTDIDLEVRLAAIAALGKIGGGEARKMLRAHRAEDAATTEAVAASLDEIDPAGDPRHLEF